MPPVVAASVLVICFEFAASDQFIIFDTRSSEIVNIGSGRILSTGRVSIRDELTCERMLEASSRIIELVIQRITIINDWLFYYYKANGSFFVVSRSLPKHSYMYAFN